MNWQQRAANLIQQGKLVQFQGQPRATGEPGWICQILDSIDWDATELANVGPFPTMAAAFREAEKAMKKSLAERIRDDNSDD